MRTPHGSRLAAIRRIEKSAAAHAWLRWCTIVSRAPLKGKATSPPAAASTLLSHPTPPHPPWRRCHVDCGCKCIRGRNAAARTLLSHPTPPHLETMPCWVWLQVWQRKERSCQDVIIPPHPTASGDATSVSKEGTQLPGRYYRYYPTHPPASGDDAILSVAASVSEEGTQLPGRYYPTPPQPPRIWRRCHLECGRKSVKGRNAVARTFLSHPTPPPRIWRRCYVDCGCNCDADVGFWVVRMVVGEWPFFGCEILLFWLRNRLFLVAESSFLVAESVFFGCGSAFSWLRKRVWFWLWNRRNLVAEASKYGFGIGIYSLGGNYPQPTHFWNLQSDLFSYCKKGCTLW